MGLGFSGTIMVDNVALPYTVEAAPYFCGHDVRILVRSATPDAERVRAGAHVLTDIVVAASAPPMAKSITPLRDEPSEYIVRILVPMKGPVGEYASLLRAYVAAQLAVDGNQ